MLSILTLVSVLSKCMVMYQNVDILKFKIGNEIVVFK